MPSKPDKYSLIIAKSFESVLGGFLPGMKILIQKIYSLNYFHKTLNKVNLPILNFQIYPKHKYNIIYIYNKVNMCLSLVSLIGMV